MRMVALSFLSGSFMIGFGIVVMILKLNHDKGSTYIVVNLTRSVRNTNIKLEPSCVNAAETYIYFRNISRVGKIWRGIILGSALKP